MSPNVASTPGGVYGSSAGICSRLESYSVHWPAFVSHNDSTFSCAWVARRGTGSRADSTIAASMWYSWPVQRPTCASSSSRKITCACTSRSTLPSGVTVTDQRSTPPWPFTKIGRISRVVTASTAGVCAVNVDSPDTVELRVQPVTVGVGAVRFG